jgi:hypothetical protein
MQKTYQIARKEFEEINVLGTDVEMNKDNENYLRHYIQKRILKCQSCLALMWIAEKTGGSNAKPRFTICCLNDAVRIPCLNQQMPTYLYEILTSTTQESMDFRTNIRFYNSTLAFTSIKSNYDKQLISSGKGSYTYRISGSINHFIGDIIPSDSQPKFAQIYIFDPHEQLLIRNKRTNNLLNQQILEHLQLLIHQMNPYVK